ncbi:MAG: sigma-54 dependent transcriptional regulator [Haliangiales bacterium]
MSQDRPDPAAQPPPERAPAHILVVDDEPRMAAAIATALRRSGHECHLAASAEEALTWFDAARGQPGPDGGRDHPPDNIDVVVTDRKMPGMDGVALMKALHQRRPDLPVILVTAFADVPSAVAAMQEGAFDYVAKPFDNNELRSVVARALELTRLQRENRYLRQEISGRYAPDAVIAHSDAMRQVLALVKRVAPAKASVLIQGESGTGKELIARLVHYWSDRVGAPFVAINCKALAPGVLESELFGHERGAYTGAAQAKQGCFERAHGGTLFLDELGEVDQSFQAKLLRVLQEGEVLRVGGTAPRRVDVRVVAATNRVLQDEIAAGNFREDLYFRLNVVPIHLPPLRQRREDILPIAERFLSGHARELGRVLRLGDDARATLGGHDWPGNVRELENVIERASLLSTGAEITPEDLLLAPTRARAAPDDGTDATDGDNGDAAQADAAAGQARADDAPTGTLQEHLDRATVARIRAALDQADGQRSRAAEILAIDRTTLYRLMKRLGI